MPETFVARVESSLADLVPTYMQRREADVVAIREAIAAGDLEIPRSLGHSMKGSGGGYGFDEVTEYGALIESAAASGDTEQVVTVTELLETYLTTVEIMIVDDEE